MNHNDKSSIFHVEGLDLSGKSLLLNGMAESLHNKGISTVSRHLTLKDNRHGRTEGGGIDPSAEIARIALDDHIEIARMGALDSNAAILQDSFHALRGAAFVEGVVAPRAIVDLYADIVRTIPPHALLNTILLTTSLDERVRRYKSRGVINAFDAMVVDNPERVIRMDNALRRVLLGIVDAHVIDTTFLSPAEVLQIAIRDVLDKPGDNNIKYDRLLSIQDWRQLFELEIITYEQFLMGRRLAQGTATTLAASMSTEKMSPFIANRLETSLKNNISTPVKALSHPILENGLVIEKGVLIVGDVAVDELIKLAPNIKDRYIIVSITQSHAVPTSPNPDIHLFSRPDKVSEYVESEATSTIPFLNITDGHYVDTDFFVPMSSLEEEDLGEISSCGEVDVTCIAKWIDTKRIHLLIETARILPHLKFRLVGIPVLSSRKKEISDKIKEDILRQAADLPNIEIIESETQSHQNDDGSVMPGGYSQEQMRALYNKTRVTICLASINEGINRSICESLSCNVPICLMSDLVGGTRNLVSENTGIIVDPLPTSIAEGLTELLNSDWSKKSPRETFMESYGFERANAKLIEIVDSVALLQGVKVNTNQWQNFYGTPWTMELAKLLEEEQQITT